MTISEGRHNFIGYLRKGLVEFSLLMSKAMLEVG